MSWRDDLRPGSFRGVPFRWAANSRPFGRRGFTYEYPNGEQSDDEDLGRRASRIILAAYVLGEDYHRQADRLEAAFVRPGGGLLVLPIMGQGYYRCEVGSRSERKEEGGFAVFECTFAPSRPSGQSAQAPEDDTRSEVELAAQQAAAASVADVQGGSASP